MVPSPCARSGMKIKRTWFAADKSGSISSHTLFQTSLKYPSIQRFDRYYAHRPAGRGRAVRDSPPWKFAMGNETGFQAGAVIIAAGGGGKMFPFTSNIKTGDGSAGLSMPERRSG